MIKTIRLAFSGSGFLAAAHVGSACAVLDAGYQIVEVAGTSGGSIVAAAIAVGKGRNELHSLAFDTDYRPLLRLTWGSLLGLRGYCNGKALHEWLCSVLGTGTIGEALIPFTAIATDIRSGHAYPMDAYLDPSLPIATACRASAAVPFVYAPVSVGGALLVDGGASNNLPESYLKQDGLRIAVDLTTPGNNPVSSVVDRATACLETLLATNEAARVALAERVGAKICKVNVQPYGFLNTDLTSSDRQTLYQRGYDAMREVLNG